MTTNTFENCHIITERTMIPLDEQMLRLRCLELAMQEGGFNAVARAAELYAFVSGPAPTVPSQPDQ